MATYNDRSVEEAQDVAQDFEETLRERVAQFGIPKDAWEVEITSCGTAEGDDLAYRPDCVYLEQLTSFRPGQGAGGAIMRILLALADERGLTVVMEVASQKFDERNPWWKERLTTAQIEAQSFRFRVPSQEELEAWYLRLGFSPTEDDGVLMLRAPGAPIPVSEPPSPL